MVLCIISNQTSPGLQMHRLVIKYSTFRKRYSSITIYDKHIFFKGCEVGAE